VLLLRCGGAQFNHTRARLLILSQRAVVRLHVTACVANFAPMPAVSRLLAAVCRN